MINMFELLVGIVYWFSSIDWFNHTLYLYFIHDASFLYLLSDSIFVSSSFHSTLHTEKNKAQTREAEKKKEAKYKVENKRIRKCYSHQFGQITAFDISILWNLWQQTLYFISIRFTIFFSFSVCLFISRLYFCFSMKFVIIFSHIVLLLRRCGYGSGSVNSENIVFIWKCVLCTLYTVHCRTIFMCWR